MNSLVGEELPTPDKFIDGQFMLMLFCKGGFLARTIRLLAVTLKRLDLALCDFYFYLSNIFGRILTKST